MKKKSKKGYKLSEETLEKLRIEAENKKKQEEEEKNKLSEKQLKKLAKKEKKKEKKEEKKRIRKENKISLPKAIETILYMVYLGFLAICIWEFFGLIKTSKVFLMYGCLTIILAFGDVFYLIPRIFDNMKRRGINYKYFWFGLGNQISSITVTWFYLILYFICKKLFPGVWLGIGFDIAVYIAVGLRVLICLLPQNEWYSDNKNRKLAILENLIFLVIGILEIILFAVIGNKGGFGLWKMAIAIGLSFVFYLPVDFGSEKYTKLRVLIIPKLLCYSWMLYMGLDLIGKV